ncbi:unnamed protein product, partial [Closterium sp. NIES-54]
VTPLPSFLPLEVSSDPSGPAEGGDPSADDIAASCRSSRLETPPRFLPWSSSPPLQPVGVEPGYVGGGVSRGAGSRVAGARGGDSVGAGSRGAGSGGVEGPRVRGVLSLGVLPLGVLEVLRAGGTGAGGVGGNGAGGVGGTGVGGAGRTGAAGAGAESVFGVSTEGADSGGGSQLLHVRVRRLMPAMLACLYFIMLFLAQDLCACMNCLLS